MSFNTSTSRSSAVPKGHSAGIRESSNSSSSTIGIAKDETICYSIRLSEEVVRRLMTGSPPKMHLNLTPSGQTTLSIDGRENHVLTRTPEAQVVDVVRSEARLHRLTILGQVKEKFAIKQELATHKMSEIRQVSEEAEKARHSRKTVTLDAQPAPVTKRKRVAAPSPSPRSTMPRMMNPGFNRRIPAPFPTDFDTHRASSSKMSNGSTSERDSQQSWSPVLADHGTHGNINPFSLDSFLDRPKGSPSVSERKISSSATLVSQRPHGAAMGRKDAKRGQVYELSEQFGRRYQEYLTLSRQVDARLSIFQKLEKDLKALKTSPDADEKTRNQVIFKVVVEQQRLKDDKEYEKTMEDLEECYAAMMVIKSRLATLVKS